MGQTLKTLVLAPEPVAMDSPAISPQSCFISSSEAEDPMNLDEVGSPLTGEGWEIRRLPKITEIDISPLKGVSVLKTDDAKGSKYDTYVRMEKDLLSIPDVVRKASLPCEEIIDTSNGRVSYDTRELVGYRKINSESKNSDPHLQELQSGVTSCSNTMGVKADAYSQRLSSGEPTVLKGEHNPNQLYGFKWLNPATLSPKLKRSLGIKIPKLPISWLIFCSSPQHQAASENNDEFTTFHDPRTSCLKGSGLKVVLDNHGNPNVKSTSAIKTTHLSNVLPFEITQQQLVSHADEENYKRSKSLSRRKGQDQLTRGASRKDSYKKSTPLRSERIAADMKSASRLGHCRRMAVLASRRSLWPSTNTSFPSKELLNKNSNPWTSRMKT